MGADGWTFAEASVDLRVGGRYRLLMTSPEGKTYVAVGEYREVQHPRRLVFTWDWEDPASSVGETLVTVEFRNAGDNRSVVDARTFCRCRAGESPRAGLDLMLDGVRACALNHYELQPPNAGSAFGSDVAEIFEVRNGKIDSLGIYFDSSPFPK